MTNHPTDYHNTAPQQDSRCPCCDQEAPVTEAHYLVGHNYGPESDYVTVIKCTVCGYEEQV
jgi:hypothetical protein